MAENNAQFLAGGGEMGELIRSMDWSKTALGPVDTWPQSLRTTVSLCLSSTFPILIAWGPETIQIYNDSYRPICGAKHPESMGQNFRICWETALPVVGDKFTRGQQGEGTYIKDQRMFLDRNGYLEEAFMTFSFAPIRDESGNVGGIFHPITETTEAMLSARRTQLLRDLAAQIGQAQTQEDVCRLAVKNFPEYVADLPFLLLYKIDAGRGEARLIMEAGVANAKTLAPTTLSLHEEGPWPLAGVLAGNVQQIDGLADRHGQFACQPYDQAPGSAMLLPVQLSGQETPFGVLVAGVSACRAMDAAYFNFYELLNNTFNTAFSNVYFYEQEQRRAEALAEIDRSKTAFFSNVSHEFRTPLTLMLGPLDELMQHPGVIDSPLIRDNITATHRNAQRLLKLVNNLLDFSRLEAGRVQAQYQPLRLDVLTTDLSSSFRSIIEKAGMKLVVDCGEMERQVYADREMWEKIVLNLLSNAFKYTLEGSITVRLQAEDEHAVLTVTDTGTGIPSKELPHMFQRFHRVEQATGRTHEGSGIGLSMVHELVMLHGGSISVSSELGTGSCFTVRIPFGRMHLPAGQVSETERYVDTTFLKGAFLREAEGLLQTSVEAPAKDAAGEKALILVVDDNSDMRQYLTRLLEEHYEVETAVHGQDALHRIAQRQPALVLSDIMMPVMDGKGLLHQMKTNPAYLHIPLIFLSARAGEEARVDGLEEGADDYLVKPFSSKELLAKIRGQIGIARTLNQRTSDLQRANEELVRINQNLEDFTYISTHDLQEPLRKIQVFADMLLEKAATLDGSSQLYLTKIMGSANRMSRLIQGLLKYSKVNRRTTAAEPVDLDRIVREVLGDFELAIKEKQAAVYVAGLPVIRAIPVQMTQLFYNLVGNALKFSDKPPVIDIGIARVSPARQAEVQGLHPRLAYHEIKVQDNGIGFEQEFADQIFTMFRRLVRADEFEGSGIGLSICRRIVENHEGAITVQSGVGKGTTFHIYLPV